MDAFEDVHVSVIRHADRLADRERRLRQDMDGIDDERVAFPMTDRMAVESRVWRFRMRPTVGVDAAQPIAVRFTEHGHAAGGEQNFHGVVCDQHPRWMRLRETSIENEFRATGLLLGPHLFDLLRYLFIPWRRIAARLAVLVGDVRIPYAAPVRQLGEISIVMRSRRRIDDGRRLLWRVLGVRRGGRN